MTTPSRPPANAAYTAAISLAQLRSGQSTITRAMVALAGRAIRLWGVPQTQRDRERIARRIYPQVRRARAQSWMLAARHLQETMPIGVAPVRAYPMQAVATAIENAVEVAAEAQGRAADARRRAEPVERAVEESPAVPRQRQNSIVVTESDEPQARPRVAVTESEPDASRKPRSRVSVDGPNEPKKARVTVEELDQVTRADAQSRIPRPSADIVAKELGATLARHAHAAGRDAARDTADESGEDIGWARVLTGAENCSFCAMLASRGPVYKSEYIATHIGGVSGDPYHNNCDCDAVLVRKGEPWEGEQEAADLEDLWVEATKGFYGKHARNAFRRAFNEARRDGLTWPEMVDRLKAQRSATKQEIADTKAWLAAEKKWKASSIEGLRWIDDGRDLPTAQGRRLRANANILAANPEYANGLEWQINCQRCVQALELRDRGYDVVAKPNFDPSPTIAKKKWSKQILDTPPFPMDMDDDQRKQLLEIMYPDKDGFTNRMRGHIELENYANQWRQADGSRREFQRASKGELIKTLEAMPVGSRGWVTTRWKKGGAHIFSWQVVEDATGNPVMRFVDPQSGLLDAAGHLDRAKPDRIAWMRVDDLHPIDAVREMVSEA